VSDWRIDDLAQRAGVAVDTIRYYQREGLLPSGERSGRTMRYGPAHLERLERIRALQSRRFSLAAIQALLDRDVPGALEGLLAGSDGGSYDRDELIAAAGVPAELARDLTGVGMLVEPAEHGRAAYDGDDVNLLRSFAELRKLAVPDAVLVEIARVYADGLDEIQRRVAAVFEGSDGPGWAPEDLARFHAAAGNESAKIAHAVRVIADYTQQRNLQRIVLHTIERHSTEQNPEHPGTDQRGPADSTEPAGW
jgi:DNA-binding transcriptional MerR regulator